MFKCLSVRPQGNDEPTASSMKNPATPVYLRSPASVPCALLLGALGCDDHSVGLPDDTGSSASEWYAVATNVFLPDGVAGHVIGTSQLSDQDLTLADSVEIPGGGGVFSAGDGTLLVGEFNGPFLTRYEVEETGRLNQSGRISFSNLGLRSTAFNPNNVFFIDSHRAYILTDSSVIRIDPEALEIVREFPLPNLERAGFTLSVGFTGFIRGNDIVFTMQWSDFAGDRSLPEVALVTFDLNDETVRVSTLEGCGGAVWGARAANGDILWSSGAFEAAVHTLSDGSRAAPPCLVRLPAGADQLSDEIIDLASRVTRGRPGGSLWGVGDGQAMIRVLEDGVETDADTTSAELTFRTNWSWYRVDLESLEIERVAGLGENGGSVFLFAVGERVLAPAIPATEDRTTLFDVTNGQDPVRTLHTPGNVYAATRAI